MSWKFLRDYSRLTQMALMFPSSIAVGVGLGYLLDRWLNTTPVLTMVFAVFGIIAGFVNLYRVYESWEKERRSKRS